MVKRFRSGLLDTIFLFLVFQVNHDSKIFCLCLIVCAEITGTGRHTHTRAHTRVAGEAAARAAAGAVEGRRLARAARAQRTSARVHHRAARGLDCGMSVRMRSTRGTNKIQVETTISHVVLEKLVKISTHNRLLRGGGKCTMILTHPQYVWWPLLH